MRISDWSSDVCSSDLLLNMRNLSPLTNNPDEWYKHTPDTWDGVNHVWQSKRNSEAFSTDGGLTYTLLSEPKSDLDANGGELPLHRTMITHTMEGQPIKPVVEETEDWVGVAEHRSEEHTSELQSLMSTSYAVFCLKQK